MILRTAFLGPRARPPRPRIPPLGNWCKLDSFSSFLRTPHSIRHHHLKVPRQKYPGPVLGWDPKSFFFWKLNLVSIAFESHFDSSWLFPLKSGKKIVCLILFCVSRGFWWGEWTPKPSHLMKHLRATRARCKVNGGNALKRMKSESQHSHSNSSYSLLFSCIPGIFSFYLFALEGV